MYVHQGYLVLTQLSYRQCQVFCGLQGVQLCQLVLKASTLQELVDAVSRETNIPGTVEMERSEVMVVVKPVILGYIQNN